MPNPTCKPILALADSLPIWLIANMNGEPLLPTQKTWMGIKAPEVGLAPAVAAVWSMRSVSLPVCQNILYLNKAKCSLFLFSR